ncbi:phosphoadenosine phosphosulfate reductase family protein [Pseudomonas sp. PS02303]|uniref:phosphoadenosine phosphosulfate reductase domain-containing protein n=1 Tax=Pseudomonas sp. PS02303 TaxID=2991429 RepID=UPI00249A5E35|nr:phosphoadenosine phosphosulfate reductase family protein [Pseudomonas sp. PS02303]
MQLFDVDLFSSAGVQEMPANVVRGPEKTLTEKIAGAVDAVKRVVRAGKQPVVAWSGGKYSSVTLNIALTAIRELATEGFAVPTLNVMHSDTRMENPVIHCYNQSQMQQMQAYAKAAGIEMKVWVAKPGLSNDYLVSLVGGRIIASVGSNAKCQQMTKADPLKRVKKAILRDVAARLGRKCTDDDIVSLIGTRFDESVQRERKMSERGESAFEAVNLAAAAGGHDWVLSPIAEMTTMDVFSYIGQVIAGRIECYDSFHQLVEVYRDMNGGDCMVNVYLAGKQSERPACGHRTGCWSCTRVSRDSSAESMIAKEGGEYDWLKPLNDLRNYIKARHFDPSARCWLARTIDKETGTIKIAPNSYSPAFTKELLGIMLTIQLDEFDAAQQAGIKPRFTLLDIQQLLAVEALWGRYGYQKPFTAMRVFLEVYEQGVRYEIPDIAALPKYTEADLRYPEVEVPFCDDQYQGMFNGLRSISHAAADAEFLTTTRSGMVVMDVVTSSGFEIDREGAELFVNFELDNALSRVTFDQSPTAGLHYLMGLGTIAIYKGDHGDWDRMMRMSNQIFRSDLQPILHDRAALITRLGGNSLGQIDLF